MSFAGVLPEFAGVDQVNVLVPRSVIGRGEVDVLLTVETRWPTLCRSRSSERERHLRLRSVAFPPPTAGS